jgi:hypothetical protein
MLKKTIYPLRAPAAGIAPDAATSIKTEATRLSATEIKKKRKFREIYWYNVKNNYLCVFIWRKALKPKEIT